jgi:TPP-dependent pyruvate/acetoin dehydrogenase alpha subunit
MSDPVHGVYRTKEEVEQEKGRDPIRSFITMLKDGSLLTDEELHVLDARAHADVDDAHAFAEASPEPEPAALYQHVYADDDVHGRLFFDRRRAPADD